MLQEDSKPVVNPMMVFREEFDDWAVLFDPETGKAFGVDPVGALIWKHLDGKHSLGDIVAVVHERCSDVPDDAPELVKEFVQSLLGHGFAGCEVEGGE